MRSYLVLICLVLFARFLNGCNEEFKIANNEEHHGEGYVFEISNGRALVLEKFIKEYLYRH